MQVYNTEGRDQYGPLTNPRLIAPKGSSSKRDIVYREAKELHSASAAQCG